MALDRPIVHAQMDIEPASFHPVDADKRVAFAVNLGLECPSKSGSLEPEQGEEDQAQSLFDQFLKLVPKVEFHLWRFAGGTDPHHEGKIADQVSDDSFADYRDLLAWIGHQASEQPKLRYWSAPSAPAPGTDTEAVATSAGASDRLRAAQAWNAPIAHKFALTHVLRPDLHEVVDQDRFVILPYFGDPGASPATPDPQGAVAAGIMDFVYDALGGFGFIVCRTEVFAQATAPLKLPVDVDATLTEQGYLKVDADAANLRRVSRWFEDRVATLTAAGPALASHELGGEYAKLFAPTFNGLQMTAPVAAWAAVAGLCGALDNLLISLLKPVSGDGSEGELLAPLVDALLSRLDVPEIREKLKDAAFALKATTVTRALRDVIRASPLTKRSVDRAMLGVELRRVLGLAKPAPDAPVDDRYLEALIQCYETNAAVTVDAALPYAIEGNAFQILFRALSVVEQRMQDETGVEGAAQRLLEVSVEPFGRSIAYIITDAYLTILGQSGEAPLHAAVEAAALPAWDAYRAVLDGAFNGAEAVRRSSGSEFLRAVLAKLDTETGTSTERVRKLVGTADYFAVRLLEPAPTQGWVADLAKDLPLPAFPSGGNPAEIKKHLAEAYTFTMAPLDVLLDEKARFIPDQAPQPLTIQIAANIDGSKVDDFARCLNGIAVGLRRIDNLDDDTKNPWAHASLADLAWGPKADKTAAGAIHPMLPAVSDGRAPMFIEYQGFPFASTELLNTRLPDSGATGARVFAPFYRQASSEAAGFARVPRLAYGRAFESFSFVTTNAGTLPADLQDKDRRPWMPAKAFKAPAEAGLIADAKCSRRTAIGQSAVSETRARTAPLRIGAPIADVAPLAGDYPRVGLFAEAATDGVRDVFRETDGRGAVVIRNPLDAHVLESRQLTDLRWAGKPKRLTLQFFGGPAAGPGQPGAVNFTLGEANGDADVIAVDLAQVTTIDIKIEAEDKGSLREGKITVTCLDKERQKDFSIAADALWLRLVLHADDPAAVTLADAGTAKPDGIDAPLLLLAPPGDCWNVGVSRKRNDGTFTGDTVETVVGSPRVGYLDFERWISNVDLRNKLLPSDAEAFEELLLTAYVSRHLDQNLAEALDRLPDPAVEQLRLELVLLDQLTGAPMLTKSAVFDVSSELGAIADDIQGKTTGEKIRFIFDQIEARFRCSVSLVSDDKVFDLSGAGNAFTATVPTGHVARLSIDALVPAGHFESPPHPPIIGGPQKTYPAVIDGSLRQYATRAVGAGYVAFPSAALRIETMLAFTKDHINGAIQLAADMIEARPIERARRYDIVTKPALEAGRIGFWKLIGEIDVTSQRWRPSGRPIYHHIAPRDFRLTGDRDAAVTTPALPLRTGDKALFRFEDEAFFDRPNIDAQTITQRLLPLPSRTVLQQHLWEAPSATYFRHRFTLRSRYAGALKASRELNAWKTDPKQPVTAWTMRVAMLADPSRILLTRPQLRALIPLTTAPGADAANRPAPPVLGILQEPPFARGGLADRVDAEIKTGFGYGFAKEQEEGADPVPVEILDSRKQIGPTPYLSYRPIDLAAALGMALMAEGPVGLTFDAVNASAADFPNSLVTLSPIGIGGAASANGQPLEEHFLGVALRRRIDPEWTPEPFVKREDCDGELCWWIDVALEPGKTGALLQYAAAGKTASLLMLETAGDDFAIKTKKLAVDGYVEGFGEKDVEIARLYGGATQLSILHQPVAPGRYSLSVYAAPTGEADARAGRSNTPLMLASFEWSPPQGNKRDNKPNPIVLRAMGGAAPRAAMASAPTFLAWTRTGRDFDFVRVTARDSAQELVSDDARITELVAMLTKTHDRLVLKRSGGTGNAAWLTSSMFLSPYPLHVHRHLAILTTRYLVEPGRPLETFCRSALLLESATELTPNGDPAENCIRVVEFETPAAILYGKPHDTAIPTTFRKAYFDLIASAFTSAESGGALRFLIRLTGAAPHLRGFTSVKVELAGLVTVSLEVPLDIGADYFTKAIELKVETTGGNLTAVRLRSDGHATPAPKKTPFTRSKLDDQNPGIFMTLEALGGGGAEFWTDVSLLHTSKDVFSREFDFTWLFGSQNDGEPALSVAPERLRMMAEAQARVVSVSPPIPIVSHDEVLES